MMKIYLFIIINLLLFALSARAEDNILEILPGDLYTCAKTNQNKYLCWGEDISDLNAQKNKKSTGLYFYISSEAYKLKKKNLSLYNGYSQKFLIQSSGLIFKNFYSSNSYYCGLTSQNEIYCWGHYLNQSNMQPILTPQPIFLYLNQPMNNLRFVSLSLGLYHICGLTEDSSVYCWGDNTHGQLGPSNTTKFSDEPLELKLK